MASLFGLPYSYSGNLRKVGHEALDIDIHKESSRRPRHASRVRRQRASTPLPPYSHQNLYRAQDFHASLDLLPREIVFVPVCEAVVCVQKRPLPLKVIVER